jgi:hypothetical protein
MFTLAAGDEQLLLHVKDIGKIEIHDALTAASGDALAAPNGKIAKRSGIQADSGWPGVGRRSAISFGSAGVTYKNCLHGINRTPPTTVRSTWCW